MIPTYTSIIQKPSYPNTPRGVQAVYECINRLFNDYEQTTRAQDHPLHLGEHGRLGLMITSLRASAHSIVALNYEVFTDKRVFPNLEYKDYLNKPSWIGSTQTYNLPPDPFHFRHIVLAGKIATSLYQNWHFCSSMEDPDAWFLHCDIDYAFGGVPEFEDGCYIGKEEKAFEWKREDILLIRRILEENWSNILFEVYWRISQALCELQHQEKNRRRRQRRRGALTTTPLKQGRQRQKPGKSR